MILERLALIAIVGLSTATPCLASDGDTFVYRIRPGDTLYALGEALIGGQRTISEIARLNRIRDVDLIYARTPLLIPRRVLRVTETPARVEAFSGTVTVSGPSGATTPQRGDLLTEGATVTTGRNSFVTLRLSDQSTVALPSQSSVRIVRLRRVNLTGTVERLFQLQNGRAKAQVTPMPDPRSTFRVNTPVSHAAVRGTIFRAAYDEMTHIALTEVDEGKVAVTTLRGPKGRESLVLPRQGIAIGSPIGTNVSALLDPPTMVEAGRPQTGAKLEFALTPVPGAQKYRIEIARDAALLDLITEEVSDQPAFVLGPLPPGTYFTRVAAIDIKGLEGTSRIYAFERRRNDLSGLLLRSGSGGRRRYQFKWNAETDGDPTFRFQLRRSGDTVPLVDEHGLKETGVVVTKLPPGHYSWRVQSIIAGQDWLIESWMPEQTFEVARRR